MTKLDPQTPTRERLIGAMLDALRTRGFHGIGLSELLTQAGAPKGVLYHHFPGGKTELAIAAIESAIAGMLASLDRLLAAHVDPADALEAWMSGAQKLLLASGFERGCPLATVALESTPEDLTLRAALSAGFAAILVGLGDTLDGAMRACVRRAVDYVDHVTGIGRAEALAFLSAAVDFQVSQAVNLTVGVHCLIRDRDLRP